MILDLDQYGVRMNVPDTGRIKVDNSDFKKHENYCISELKTFSSDFVYAIHRRKICGFKNKIDEELPITSSYS